MKKNLHVVPHNDGWAVRKEGSNRASSVHDTQKDAIASARLSAIKSRGELVIHGRNGRIRDKDSYGNDPCPPPDTKH
jgi:hypothetical protein